MQYTLESFTLNDVKLSDIESGTIDTVMTHNTWHRMALNLRRVGDTNVRGKMVDFLCEASCGRGGRRKLGYYRCSMIDGKLKASLVARSYNDSYHPQQTIEEYESSLHFDSIVRRWRFDDTPGGATTTA